MHSRPVLARRNDLALRERSRQASLEGDDVEICRLVESDGRPRARCQRAAQPAADIPPRRAHGVPPSLVQRSVDSNELFVFDELARRLGPLNVQQIRVPTNKGHGPAPARFAAGLCLNAPPAARAAYPLPIRPACGDFAPCGRRHPGAAFFI
jgi:hypothetical protein